MGTLLNKKLGKVLLAVLIAAVPFSADAAAIIRAPNNLGLVGYWSFDEGRGTQVSDLSGRGNNGTLINGPTWTTGKVGGAMEFDGVNDIVSLPSNWGSGVDFTEITGAAWVYSRSNSGTKGLLEGRGTDFHWEVTDGKWRVRLGGFDNRTSVDPPPLNEWTHVAFTYNRSTGQFRYYVNGANSYSTVGESGASTFFTTSRSQFGDSNVGQRFWNGKMDDIRFYSRALSPTEIQTLYNNTKGVIVGTINNTYTDGLVAHYTFDGSTISGITVQDVVGGNDGTITGAVSPAIGRIGQGLRFSSSGGAGHITVPHSSSLNVDEDFTIHMCLKSLSDKSFTAIAKTNLYFSTGTPGWHMSAASSPSDLLFEVQNGTSRHYIAFEIGRVFDWTCVAATKEGREVRTYTNGEFKNSRTLASDWGSVANSLNLRIGNFSSTHHQLDGLMDDVRIYNRALSPEEIRGLAGSSIATLHSSQVFSPIGGLIAHWPFDEGVGSVTKNTVTNNNDSIMGSGVSWMSGVREFALHFDGVGNGNVAVVDLPLLENFSLSAWVNNESGGVSRRSILSNFWEIEWSGGNSRLCFWSYEFSSEYWRCSAYGSVPQNEWAHVATTWDGSRIRHYVNGQLVWTDSNTSSGTSQSFYRIAGYGGREFKGGLDDLRVYNRTLTDGEIQTLYSMGQ